METNLVDLINQKLGVHKSYYASQEYIDSNEYETSLINKSYRSIRALTSDPNYYVYLIIFKYDLDAELFDKGNLFYVGQGKNNRIESSVKERIKKLPKDGRYRYRPIALKMKSFRDKKQCEQAEQEYINGFINQGYKLMNRLIKNVECTVDIFDYKREYIIYQYTYKEGLYGMIVCEMLKEIYRKQISSIGNVQFQHMWDKTRKKCFELMQTYYDDYYENGGYKTTKIDHFFDVVENQWLGTFTKTIMNNKSLYTNIKFSLVNIKKYINNDIYFYD